MNAQQGPSIIYRNRDMSRPVLHEVAGGTAAVFSARGPEKASANEDSGGLIPLTDTSAVLVVADGMGGHEAGEVASRTAIREMILAVRSASSQGQPLRSGIINGFEAANQAVQDLGTDSGTTLAAVEISGGMARLYHAGDSIILVVGARGKIKQETVSHSPVGYGLAAGFLDSTEAMMHEDRHMVLNAIGWDSMRIEIGSAVKLSERDTILLASDGLTDNVHLEEAVEIIRKGKLEASTQQLAQLASERMKGVEEQPSKPDDLTIIAYRRSPGKSA